MKKIKLRMLSGNTIKMIAVIAMVIDHFAWAFVPTESIAGMLCHSIGRITAPVMCYFIAEGNHYTKNRKRYIGRLVIFALISHIPYNLYATSGNPDWIQTSMIFTLLCGLLALMLYQSKVNVVVKWIGILMLMAATVYADWSIWGVLFVLVFGMTYGNFKKQVIAFLCAASSLFIFLVVSYGFNIYTALPNLVGPLLAVLCLSCYNGTKGGGRYSKWFFYIVYPTQFLVIGGLALLLGKV